VSKLLRTKLTLVVPHLSIFFCGLLFSDSLDPPPFFLFLVERAAAARGGIGGTVTINGVCIVV